MPDGPGLHRLAFATHAINPAAPEGPYAITITGSVNIVGGSGGGTSQVEGAFIVPGSSVTPIGAYYGGRTVASGGVFAPAISGSAILQVEVVTGSINTGAAGGGFATVGVYGSVGVAPIGTFTVWNANNAGGSAFATVGVYGSVSVQGTVNIGGQPLSVLGSVGVTPLASFTVNLGNIPTVNLGLGTVNVGNAHGIFGSVSVLGTVNVANALGIFGSVGVLGTVNLGSIATVNLGLGTVNIGNAVGVFGSVSVLGSVNLGGQPIVVDTRGSTAPTQWAIQVGASGPNVLFNAPGAGSIKLSGITLIANATVNARFQSPSGTDLTGSLTVLPGAGFAMNNVLRNPVMIGAATATWNLWLSTAVPVGGWAIGWIE